MLLKERLARLSSQAGRQAGRQAGKGETDNSNQIKEKYPNHSIASKLTNFGWFCCAFALLHCFIVSSPCKLYLYNNIPPSPPNPFPRPSPPLNPPLPLLAPPPTPPPAAPAAETSGPWPSPPAAHRRPSPRRPCCSQKNKQGIKHNRWWVVGRLVLLQPQKHKKGIKHNRW